jgi:protein subunit release factor A
VICPGGLELGNACTRCDAALDGTLHEVVGALRFHVDDLEMHSWPPRRYGGQHVGLSAGVLVVHVPTGIAVVEENERSQLRNREVAIDRLRELVAFVCGR